MTIPANIHQRDPIRDTVTGVAYRMQRAWPRFHCQFCGRYCPMSDTNCRRHSMDLGVVMCIECPVFLDPATLPNKVLTEPSFSEMFWGAMKNVFSNQRDNHQ